MRTKIAAAGAALAAAALITGCKGGTVAGSGTPTAHAAAKPSLTCAQIVRGWYHADGKRLLGQVTSELGTAHTDGLASNWQGVADEFTAMGVTGSRMPAHPMPACADPAGYWDQLGTRLVDVAQQAPGVAQSDVAALTTAGTDIGYVAQLETQLITEVKAVR